MTALDNRVTNLENVKTSIGERFVLRMLDKKYKWIARDKDGNLFVYEEKPVKERKIGGWYGVICAHLNLFAFNHHFQFIIHSKKTPTSNCKAIKWGMNCFYKS